VRRALTTACSFMALAFGWAPLAQAQDAPAPQQTQPQGQQQEQPRGEASERRIVVIGNRSIVASLEDVDPEQVYDEDRVQSYDVSTLGELLGDINEENGDDEPSVLVNGQPVSDLGDVADVPVEAIERIEQLPRGSAQRVNGTAGQRAYNVVLRSSVKSLTTTGSYEEATEGGWRNIRGEGLVTYISGQDRVNVTVRGADSSTLFESERDVVPRTTSTPYAPVGNVIPFAGTQVDPALSALAGQAVTVVALPAGNTNPTLVQLVPFSNQTNPSLTNLYRSLRGASRPYEVAVSGNKTLTPWLSLSFNGRIGWSDTDNFSGLPSARFQLPSTNPFTPFTVPVYIALNDPTRPLTSESDTTSKSLSATLAAAIGDWRANVIARYDERDRSFVSHFTSSSTLTVGATTNPFAGGLGPTIPVTERLITSDNTNELISADAEGPLFSLWAGPLRARAGLSAAWVGYEASDPAGQREFHRHELTAKAGITIPLTSRDPAVLPELGESELTFDIGTIYLGRFGELHRHSFAFNWQPNTWLNFVASETSDERAISPELLAAPEVVTPNVPYFDPVTAQTVDVTTIYGGAGALVNDELRIRRLSLDAHPLPKNNLQLGLDYTVTDFNNQIGALPPPSSQVAIAFPDRFVRDLTGTLVLVDNRSVNFEREHTRSLNFSVGFMLPITKDVTIPANRDAGTPTRRIRGWKLQVNASYLVLLEDTVLIRSSLPRVDLLEGGAIGIGGGQPEHSTSFNLALTKGNMGLRVETRRRGESLLVIGTPATPDLLTFDSVTTVDAKVFADLGQLFPRATPLRDTRITLAVDNLFNDRQRVTNNANVTPQAYQPVYRDPIGRTLLVEIRKVF